MLRIAFIVSLLLGFSAWALRGPLEALMLYLWLAYFRPESWVWTPFFRTVPLSFVAGGYLLLRVLFSSARFRFDMRAGLMTLFLVLALASGLNSTFVDRSTSMFMDVSKAFLISYLLAVLTDTPGKFRIILQTIAFSLAFEGAKQAWVQLATNPGAINNNPIPFLGDNNGVAVGMLMLVPIFVVLARTTEWKWERYLYWFLCVGVLYRAISTYSRGGFLAALAMGLVFIWRSPKRVPAMAGGALVALVIAAALPQQYWDRMATIEGEERDNGTEFDNSAQGRLHFWSVALRMADDMPIGVGPGAFQDAYPSYDTSNGRYGRRRAVHSTWFGTIAELGYGGLVILLAVVFLAWRSTKRAQVLAARGEIPRDLGLYGAGLEASLVAFVVGGTFLNMQYVEMFWHFVALTMSLNWNVQNALAPAVARPGTEAFLMSPRFGGRLPAPAPPPAPARRAS